MKKIIIIFVLILFFLACKPKKKQYFKVLLIEDTDLNGKIKKIQEIDTLFETNDTLALKSVFNSFMISKVLDEKYKKNNVKDYTKTIDYYLLDSNKKVVFNFLNDSEKEKILLTVTQSLGDNFKSTSSYQDADNVCQISEDFIKQDLRHPSSADFSSLDCSVDKNADGSYTILRKITAQNSLGVEGQIVYKVTLGFKGGIDVDLNNWQLINIRSQEIK